MLPTVLGGCGSGLFTKYVGVTPNLPELPKSVEQCIKRHVKLPRGDWTVQMVADVVAKYRRREIELEGCLANVEMFYTGLQRELAKK